MMSIKVKIPFLFQSKTGGAKTVELNNCTTVGECLIKIRTIYPLLGEVLFDQGDNVAQFLSIFVNGECLPPSADLFHSPVKNGDEIYPVELIEGG
jgi:hypothetical protein